MDFIVEEWPYLSWAFGAAALFYTVTAFATSHMHPDKKAVLELWLEGSYNSSWTEQFCAIFDGFFGEKHFGLRCFIRSAISSVLSVFALWVLLDQILGLISVRTDTGLTLLQALVLGATINILPDYLSLYQTRWLLQQFQRVSNPFGQFALLLVDIAVTGLIIFVGIEAYLWFTGQAQIALVEMVALFSLYAVFFYSTFLTSVWAWVYCLSSWFTRASAGLQTWLDVANAPGRTLALLGAFCVFLSSMAIQPVLNIDEDGRTAFDNLLCDLFPASVCQHLARMTDDEQVTLDLLSKACEGGAIEECYGTALQLYQIRPEQAARHWTKSCESGNAYGCSNLGLMYRTGLGVTQDFVRAAELFQQACEEGYAGGCTNLGVMYQSAKGVTQDFVRAAELYQQACEQGDAQGCAALGFMYQNAEGVSQDLVRAAELYQQACEERDAQGCTALGFAYQFAIGVAEDIDRAVELYQRGCGGADTFACDRLKDITE
ncbi:tetratricopeptide repeat protein [Parvibaculum sp.]|uniref:tetratricopeptide repeat protein n=1 Tax=Parvibaculum sp. TaxID=2024848 RepID=UPI003267D839